ncbi:LysR substrate-binding domain-containing protein [Azospirillum halopraeferens]|uniref:LysR substrate-binding domain-containing protein n=1 Tax=Azospirillum halopraeferens TaxID=34010 RepID=UPI000403C336|nr:LysR substrate-binding domain-containing protein [Azospirillum halopraeferens]
MRKLPPLNAIRAFEAAARHLSFTLAANELNVTITAVSHQIRHLEATLGMKLFERNGGSVTLSAVGERLFPAVRDGFDRLAEAFEEINDRRSASTVAVTTTRAFADRWLLPRLAGFQRLHPDVTVDVDACEDIVDLRSEGVDLAIRYGRMAADGDGAEALIEDRYGVVVSSLAWTEERDPTAQDVSRFRLLGYRWRNRTLGGPDWPAWLHLSGLGDAAGHRINWFSEETLAIRAMEHGHGMLLCSMVLVADTLRAGQVRRIAEPTLPGFAFRLVSGPLARRKKAVQAFSAWLRAEAEAEKAGAMAPAAPPVG